MSTYSQSIRGFLLSVMTDKDGLENGYGVNNIGTDGNYYHYNEVIEKCYNSIFEKMNIKIDLPEEFKKNFCKKFYNREIAYEVFSQFFIELEILLNTDCYNLLRMYKEIKEMLPEDMLTSIDMNNDSKASGDNDSLAIQNANPKNDLDILYNRDGKGVIKYANALGENYGKQKQESSSHTTGWSGRSKFEMLNYYARITDIETQIFNILENKIFMQMF